jgi:hypothetical protein
MNSTQRVTALRLIAHFEFGDSECSGHAASLEDDDGRLVALGCANFGIENGDVLEVLSRFRLMSAQEFTKSGLGVYTTPLQHIAQIAREARPSPVAVPVPQRTPKSFDKRPHSRHAPSPHTPDGVDEREQEVRLAREERRLSAWQKLDGLVENWASLGENKMFREAQDVVCEQRYLVPASTLAETSKVTSPLGLAIFWDMAIQHGMGADPDSLPEVWKRAKPRHAPEVVSLTYLLHGRRTCLLAPRNTTRRKSWPTTVSRVKAWEHLLQSRCFELSLPLIIDLPTVHLELEAQ